MFASNLVTHMRNPMDIRPYLLVLAQRVWAACRTYRGVNFQPSLLGCPPLDCASQAGVLRYLSRPPDILLFLDEENPARSGGTLQIVMVIILTVMVLKDTYVSADRRNLILASLWAAGVTRIFFWKPSKFFWFNSRIHSMLSWTMTLVSSYHAYRRPSIENICLPAFWCAASLSQLHSLRSPSGLKQLALKALGCGLVVYSFWNGSQIRHITDVPEMIIQTLLCSPVTLIVM
ncbi:uncharacterized protein ACMZJ9_009880 [Mantella aurantiaca]